MVRTSKELCPICKGKLTYYDSVKRIVRSENRKANRHIIRRLYCDSCKSYHRELPNHIYPYKQYDARIILGVITGTINSDSIEYEDYPCEATMNRWRTRKIQALL
jgi:hypothetical protein